MWWAYARVVNHEVAPGIWHLLVQVRQKGVVDRQGDRGVLSDDKALSGHAWAASRLAQSERCSVSPCVQI